MTEVRVRLFRPADGPVLLRLFRDTIRRVNSRDYTPEQVAAWASDDIDTEAWFARFDRRFAIVAEVGARIVGFTELEEDGHIDRFYVSADHQGQGVGGALMTVLLAHGGRRGIGRVFAEVSLTARPFFERHGFRAVEARTVNVRGVDLRNDVMERRSGPNR